MAGYKQGYFKPKHPEKYKGRVADIVYRSSLELKVLMYLDNHPQVVRYASEESFMIVSYVNPITGRSHRYFPDIWFERKDASGKILTFLVEIKPHSQTLPPPKDKNGKISKKYLRMAATYGINMKKWEAARVSCDKKGWIFKLISERDIN